MPILYGCGKSTLTRTRYFGNIAIIDPDDAIALHQSDDQRIQTQARIALTLRREALESGQTHLIETTLSGKGIFRHVESARKKEYLISLHYICLESVEIALARIRNRVKLGGHDVKQEDVVRRFVRSYDNLPIMIAQSDEACLYDNSDPDQPLQRIAKLKHETWWNELPSWAVKAMQKSNQINQH